MNWKEIVGFEGRFSISDCGIIKNDITGKELKTTISKKGYHQVSTKPFGRNGKTKVFRIHREVALAFIPNLYNKSTVNHIDGDKNNNYVSNLEWATVSENIQHAFDNKLSSTCLILLLSKCTALPELSFSRTTIVTLNLPA